MTATATATATTTNTATKDEIQTQLKKSCDQLTIELIDAYLDKLVDIVDKSSDKMLESLNTATHTYKTPKVFAEWNDYIQLVNRVNSKSMSYIPTDVFDLLMNACRGYTLEDIQNKYLLCKLSLADVNCPNLFMYFCNMHYADIIDNLIDSQNISHEIIHLTAIEESLFGTDQRNDYMYNAIKLMTQNASRDITNINLVCTTYKASIGQNGKCAPDRLISIFDRPSIMVSHRISPTSVKSSFIWTYDANSPAYLFDKYHSLLNQLTIVAPASISPQSPVVNRYNFDMYTKMLTTQTALSGLHEYCKNDAAAKEEYRLVNAKTSEQINLSVKSDTFAKFMFNYPHIDHRFNFDVATIRAVQSSVPKTISSYTLHRPISSRANLISVFASNCEYQYCAYTNTESCTVFNKQTVAAATTMTTPTSTSTSGATINVSDECVLQKLLREIYFVLFDSFRRLLNCLISLDTTYTSPFELPKVLTAVLIGVFNELTTALLCRESAQFDTAPTYVIDKRLLTDSIVEVMQELITVTLNKGTTPISSTKSSSSKKRDKKKKRAAAANVAANVNAIADTAANTTADTTAFVDDKVTK